MWGDFSVPIPAEDGVIKQDFNNMNALKQLNLMPPIHLSYEGTLYCWGDDTENKYGVLGLGNQYKAQRPCPNSQLFDYMIKSISLAETHTCAVDSTGRLFCWGYGPNGELGLENQVQQTNVPTIVTKQKQITIKKAAAHSTYTVFCSSAGYVFLFGSLRPQLSGMRMSQTTKFSGQFKMPFLQSIDKFSKDQQPQQHKQTNKPINAMTQIISLSETFVNDIICGDSFILCMTSHGDLFFVDDALESVQISILPVESVAISGTKILGISQGNRLYEWSTAGLNKLSFNKENKLLLRQDFQIKEYQIIDEFSMNVKLCNLPLLKNQIGLTFEDVNQQANTFIQKQLEDNNTDIELNKDHQMVIAKLVPQNNKNQHYNPICNDSSSMNDTQDQIEEEKCKSSSNFDSNNICTTNVLQTSPDSFKNDTYTPDISIAVNNEFKSNHNQQPSFQIQSQIQEQDEQCNNPTQFVNTKEYNNIFNFHSDNLAENKVKIILDSPSLIVKNQDDNQANNNQTQQFDDDFKPIQNQTQFFMHSQNNLNLEMPSLNQNFPYRPSSIKSYVESNDKSNCMLFNHNSSPSMKQCTEQMMNNANMLQLGNSKIELSYPSFINNSQDIQQQEGNQNSDNNYNDNNSSKQDLQEDEELQQVQVQEYNTTEEDQQMESLHDQSHTPVQISIQQQLFEEEEKQEDDTYRDQRVEYQIKFNSQGGDPINISQSNLCNSRDASIIRTTRKVDDGIEESMEITIDNIKISTKRTTTPKRILTNYSQSKRMSSNSCQQANQSLISNSRLSEQQKSPISQHSSELSNGFNITQNSISHQDRKSNLLKQYQKAQVQVQQLKQQQIINNKNSNSCEQFKKRSFMHAMINNRKHQQIDYTKPTSQTQIYEINPLQDQTMNSQNLNQVQQPIENNVIYNLDEYSQHLPQLQMQQSNSQQEDTEGIYYVFGDQTSQNLNQSQNQLLSQTQLQKLQQRYSNLNPNNQQHNNQLPPRDSFGRMTHMTEDNLEIEYSISNSCTPESKQQSTNIKRRINFDEASGQDGYVIRVSDVNSANNRLINSFTVNLNQPSKTKERYSDMSQGIQNKSSYPYQLQNPLTQFNQTDQSQSFLFNQSQNSICPQVQPFNDDNLVSNIKSASTPSQNGNTTHIMMLTEEKFKNLKTEISQQQDNLPVSNFIIPQVNLHHSPIHFDQANTTQTPRNDGGQSSNQHRGSNIQNLSSFILHSKYFQVYENYRRGFTIINQIKNRQLQNVLNILQNQCSQDKQREEKLIHFSRHLSNLVKTSQINLLHHGFKRIKKIYKEKQLRVYIQQKQNQFAKQTSALIKVDQIIQNTIHNNLQHIFKALLNNYLQHEKIKQDKRKRSIIQLTTIMTRKTKQSYEKGLRSITNWANLKRVLEANSKLLSRVLIKLMNKQKRDVVFQIRNHITLKQKLGTQLQIIHQNNLKYAFNNFQVQVKQKINKINKQTLALKIIDSYLHKSQEKYGFAIWKQKICMQKKVVIALEMMLHINEQQQKYKYFQRFRKAIEEAQIKEKYFKSMKPSLLLLFKKIDDIRKNNCKIGFEALLKSLYHQEETMLINKSGALTNLSFTLQQPVEMSLILNKRIKNDQNKVSNTKSGSQSSRNHYRTQQQPPKSVGKQYGQGIPKVSGYQTNIYQNQTVIDKSSNKKPTLNDYLSFTPGSGSNQKQGNNNNNTKFFNHKRNDAGYSSARNSNNSKIINEFTKNEKQYLDCPIPLKDFQEKQNKKDYSKFLQKQQEEASHHQQSYENLNQLNVSIKDMNKAFRDQISRIKEKQQEEIDKSYMSSMNNMFGQDQSFDNQLNQLQIELTQTPDQLFEESETNYKKKLIFDHQSKNISPKINPLCTSESYQMFGGGHQNQFGIQLYSVEQQKHQQSIQTINNKINSQAPLTINQDFNSAQANKIILSDKINDHQVVSHNALPQTSTFGELKILSQHSNDEDVEGSYEEKFESINRTQNPQSHRDQEELSRQQSDPGSNFAYGPNITRKKSDQRYQINSVIDHDYSIDMQNQQDMFENLEQQNQQQQMQRVQSVNNINQGKQSNQNHSRVVNHNDEISYDFIEIQKNLMQKKTFDIGSQQQQQQIQNNPIQHAFKMYQQHQKNQDDISNQTKILNVSPKFDESFVPSQINRDLLNEMAANYQMLELTPDGDYNMLLHNKSVFQREGSVYSNNQYAEPIEMTISPRGGQIPDVSAINYQNLTTNQSQLNCYGMVFDVNKDKNQSEDNDYDDEYQEQVSQLIDYGRESRPYDFELSSNSKYKIISENQFAKQILTTEATQPSILMPSNNNVNNSNICKKLSFGYDMTKKNNNLGKSKQKSTLIVSGGEQTINFNLTQEEDGSFQMVDYDTQFNQQYKTNQSDIEEEDEEDFDVGEEIPAEQPQKIQKTLPESRILQQELQEEKFNMTLTQQELMQITQNRLQMLNSNNQSYGQTQRDTYTHQRNNKVGQDFIQNNIQKLRNMIKASPRYQNIETNQNEDFSQRVNSNNQSTRNATSSNNILFNKKNLTQTGTYDVPQQFQTQVSRQSNSSVGFLPNSEQQHIYRSFAYNQTTNFAQNNPNQQSITHLSTKTASNTRKPKTQYLMPSTARNPSKENRNQTKLSSDYVSKMIESRKPSINQQAQVQPQLAHQNSQKVLRDISSQNQRKSNNSGNGYQPLTFRATTQHQSNNNSNIQYNSNGSVSSNQHPINISYQSNSQTRMAGSNQSNGSSVSINTNRLLNGSGNATLNTTQLGNMKGNVMQERRISHQDISVNLSGGQGLNSKPNSNTSLSGFGKPAQSQKSAQMSLTGRTRNQPDKVQTMLSMGSKVIQQNVNQIYRNQQVQQNNASQSYNYFRQSAQSNTRNNQ